MRLDINLATHPHEDARSFYFRASAALGAIALLTALLVLIAARQWRPLAGAAASAAAAALVSLAAFGPQLWIDWAIACSWS